jgi:hypothetical protein
MSKGKKNKDLKNRKHNKIVNDYEKVKSNHLENLATKMLKKDEKNTKLKEKNISTNFLKLF